MVEAIHDQWAIVAAAVIVGVIALWLLRERWAGGGRRER
jgi:hypothetical protein